MGYEKLEKSVINDLEAQFSGDVEAPFFEMPYQAGIPPVATDKQSTRIYADAAGNLCARNALGAVQNIGGEAASGSVAREVIPDHAGAAVPGPTTENVFRALRPGTIEEVAACCETGIPAAGESMQFDVIITPLGGLGQSVLQGPITIDDTYPAVGTLVDGLIDSAHKAFAKGDMISIVRTYVAGGAPTPMADTQVLPGIKWS